MNELAGFIQNYGWVGAICLGILYILFRFIEKLGIYWIDKRKKEKDTEIQISSKEDLKLNPFFSYAQFATSIEIPTLEICPDKPVKQQVFRDLILIRTEAFLIGFKEFIDKNNFDDWSGQKWAAEVSKMVSFCISQYENKASDYGIPEIVIDKFNSWDATSQKLLYDYVVSLGDSKIFNNNIIRMNIFLIVAKPLLITFILGAEKTLNDINGEIANKNYKGLLIEH